ncbi:hypothetical protein ACWEF9_09270 [Streptomyces sp. NPDC004980]
MERAGIRLATAFRVMFDTTSEQVDTESGEISPPEVATLTAMWERIEEVVSREELAAAIAALGDVRRRGGRSGGKSADLDAHTDVVPSRTDRDDMADQRVSFQKFHDQLTDTRTTRALRRCDLQQ